MIHRLIAVALLAAISDAVGADPSKDESKKLEGTWTVESASKDGKPDDGFANEIAIAGDRLAIKPTKGKEQTRRFRVDPSKDPKTIDFIPIEPLAKNAAFGLGIYELDGDKLKLCIGAPDKRPTELSDKGSLLLVLKRKKS
jgi:uncharacterized protein (TIGR03067 family)